MKTDQIRRACNHYDLCSYISWRYPIKIIDIQERIDRASSDLERGYLECRLSSIIGTLAGARFALAEYKLLSFALSG